MNPSVKYAIYDSTEAVLIAKTSGGVGWLFQPGGLWSGGTYWRRLAPIEWLNSSLVSWDTFRKIFPAAAAHSVLNLPPWESLPQIPRESEWTAEYKRLRGNTVTMNEHIGNVTG